MVPFGRYRTAIVVFILTWCIAWPVDAGMPVPTTEEFNRLLDGPADELIFVTPSPGLCDARDCSALWDIHEVMAAMVQRDFPNTMARLVPGPGFEEREREVTRSFRRNMQRHPERMRTYCGVLAIFSKHYADYHFAYMVLEIALRLSRPGMDCLSYVIAALPVTGETDDLLQASRSSNCELKLKGCERIVRPP